MIVGSALARGETAFTSAEHGVWWLVLGFGVGILVLGLLTPDVGPWTPPGGRRCSRRWTGARIFEPPLSAADDRRQGR